ncbi:MAG: twin-arginine translocation signal domain-containing protein, partial [Desulfovibrio sp.]
MKEDVKKNQSVEKSSEMTRRDFIKSSAVVGAGVFATASVGPWFVKNALSSSGELNLFTWPDYSKPEVIAAFESSTGIKCNVTNYSTNQE